MAVTPLAAGLLFGVALLGTVAVLASRGWRHYSPATLVPARRPSLLVRLRDSPAAWAGLFVIGVGVVAAGAVVAVSGSLFGLLAVPAAVQAGAATAVAVSVGGGLVLYLLYGTFTAARDHGLGNAQAVALVSWVGGLLFLVGVAARLLGYV